MQTYTLEPSRYQLRRGIEEGAPSCPFGNPYTWIGFDLKTQEYLRFTKSVFKLLVNQVDTKLELNEDIRFEKQ